MALLQSSSFSSLTPLAFSRIDRREYIFPYERTIQCSLGDTTSKNETITKHLLSCFAASVMLISAPNQVIAAVTDNGILKFDDEKGSGMLMMRGMTANNFDPVRYSGRWFEVASLKRGFAGQGQEDCHCTQINSRTPTLGPAFIEKYKLYLANYGYDPSKIEDTPQYCEVMSNSQLALMMSKLGMQQAFTNQFPDLELKSAVEFNPFTNVFDTFKKLLALYFK